MQYPSNVTPNNTPIDKNEPFTVSFTFKGEKLIGVIADIVDCDTGDHLGHYINEEEGWESWVIFVRLLDDKLIYNNDRVTLDFSSATAYMQNGKNYMYTLKLCQNVHDIAVTSGKVRQNSVSANTLYVSKDLNSCIDVPYVNSDIEVFASYIKIGSEKLKVISKNDADEFIEITVDGEFSKVPSIGDSFVIYSNCLKSKPYFLPCRTSSEATATASISTDNMIIQCSAVYNQQENVTVKKYKWTLLKNIENAWFRIAESGYIYSGLLSYDFLEYVEKGYQYKAICEIINQYDVSVFAESDVFELVNSEKTAIDGITLETDYNRQCFKIQINKISDINTSVYYNIYRQTDESDIRFISKCETGYFEDFLVSSGHMYKYYIIPVGSDGAIYNTYISENIQADFEEWSLTQLKNNGDFFGYKMYNTKEIYKFCTDTSSDDFTINQQRNTDVSITGDININTSEKYFISGGLSAILGKITDNMDFEDTIQDNEKFIDLISSDSEFLLKSPKGHMYIISISDNVSFNFDSVISSYPTTVKFKFSEIVKADDIIINC